MKKNRKRLAEARSSGDCTPPRSGPARRGRLFDSRHENRGHESPVNGTAHLPMRCQFPAALHRSASRGEELRTVHRRSKPPPAIPHGEPTSSFNNGRRPKPNGRKPDPAKERFPEIPPNLDAQMALDVPHRRIDLRTDGRPEYYVEKNWWKSLVRLNSNKRQIPNHRCRAPGARSN